MKKTLLATAFLVLAALGARGEVRQVWARGVTEGGGWQNTAQWYNGCWAACATDMIAWWKKSLAARYDVTGVSIGTSEEVNRVFDKNPYFGDNGDYVWKGLEFVFTNSVPELAITYPKLIYQNEENAAIYRFYVPHGTAASRGYLIYQRGWLNSEKAKVEEAFKDFIDANGDVIVALGDTRHVWVLYGVEYDTDTGRLNRIWVTNSSSDTGWKPGLQVFSSNYMTYEGKDLITFTRSFTVKYTVDDEEIEETWTEPISPHEFTYLSVADEVLVNSAGELAFKRLGGDTPAFDHIRPGVAARFASQEEADAFIAAFGKDRPSFVTPPDGLPDGFKTRYAGLFEVKRVDLADGAFAVEASLTAEARETAQRQVDGMGSLDLKTLNLDGLNAAFETTPGLYYSVLAGETLNDLKVRSSTLATGESLELTFPKMSASGFYRVKATVSAETVHTDL